MCIRDRQKLKQATEGKSITVLVGAPISDGTKLFNAGVVISSGSILGVVPKTFLPNYGEFYEQRWFASADDLWADEIELCGEQVPIGTDLLFELGDAKIGVEICEDLWVNDPPSIRHAQALSLIHI